MSSQPERITAFPERTAEIVRLLRELYDSLQSAIAEVELALPKSKIYSGEIEDRTGSLWVHSRNPEFTNHAEALLCSAEELQQLL